LADKIGQSSRSTGFFAADGDAQSSTFVLRNTTTNATPTNVFLDGSAARLSIASGKVWAFNMLIVAKDTGNMDGAGYRVVGCIKNNGGTTALVGTVTTTVLGEDQAAWDVAVTADNTNDALDIKCTGAAARTIRWVASVSVAEVG